METPEEWFNQNANRIINEESLIDLDIFLYSLRGSTTVDKDKYWDHIHDHLGIIFYSVFIHKGYFNQLHHLFLDQMNMRLINFMMIWLEYDFGITYTTRTYTLNEESLYALRELNYEEISLLGTEIRDNSMTFRDYFPINSKAKSARKTLN